MVESIAPKMGCVPSTLLDSVKQAEVHAGGRPGTTSAEHDRVKALGREVKELRRATEILKLASALSLLGVLGTRHHLSQRKIRNLLDELMGLSCSVGAISQAHGKLSVALKAPVADAAAALCTADDVILDFIGQNCTAAVTTDRYTGHAFIDAACRQVCGTECGRQVSSGHLTPDEGLSSKAQRGLQGHPLRDFNRIGQRHGLAGHIGRRLLEQGLVMFRKRDKAQFSRAVLDRLQRRTRAALERGAGQ